jgi:hypothetical protein
MSEKTLHNTKFEEAAHYSEASCYGDGDAWKLICKAWSKKERWMKSTKAMQIDGVGCLVQVTTQVGDAISEAVTFVPGVEVEETKDSESHLCGGRKLVLMKKGG